MEKKSKNINIRVLLLVSIIALISLQVMSSFTYKLENKALWNLCLAIPVAISFIINAKQLKKIRLSISRVLISIGSFVTLCYLFPFNGPYGAYRFYVVYFMNLPIVIIGFIILTKYTFNVTIFPAIVMVSIAYCMLFLLVSFIGMHLPDSIHNTSFMIYAPLIILISLLFPLTIPKEY